MQGRENTGKCLRRRPKSSVRVEQGALSRFQPGCRELMVTAQGGRKIEDPAAPGRQVALRGLGPFQMNKLADSPLSGVGLQVL